MRCCIADLRDKEVVNLCDGKRLGYVCDVEVDTCDGKLVSIIVPGESKCFSFSSSRNDDIVIPWDKINKIGDDLILVSINIPECRRECDCDQNQKKKKGIFF